MPLLRFELTTFRVTTRCSTTELLWLMIFGLLFYCPSRWFGGTQKWGNTKIKRPFWSIKSLMSYSRQLLTQSWFRIIMNMNGRIMTPLINTESGSMYKDFRPFSTICLIQWSHGSVGIKVQNMKMDFNIYGTWRRVGQWTLMMINDFFYSAKSFSHPL